ncbi:MAG: sigma-70 family RNA polymerase sigma factor [Dysgonamonadaceae bacterium]|jgi:RNA polymerase sigma-70 factor (ECF subfamily)|nr:sigma-70 family RNA polymerase sigma factor [Dysgonamonadaceae bacterium]
MKNIFKKMREFERIIETYQNSLFSSAFFRLGSFETAQVIVQEVLLNFYETMSGVSMIDNIYVYLIKSINDSCADYKKQSLKIPIADLYDPANKLPDAEKTSCLSEYNRIEEILRSLPEVQAEVLRLKFVDNLNFDEISQVLAESLSTVKSRYRYANIKLIRKNFQSSRL